MAKKKKTSKSTVVKNGKRLPADRKGKPEKKKPKANPAADKRTAEKKARKDAIARNVARMTKTSRTLIGQLNALVVEGYDEPKVKAEAMKEEIGGLTGQISEHNAEIRRLAREEKDLKEPGELSKLGKALAGLERDVERWRVQLTGKKEQRQGYKETMKAADAEIHALIKETASGQMRIDQPEPEKQEGGDTPSGKASSPSVSSATSPDSGATSSPSSVARNGTHRPSKSTVAPEEPTVPPAEEEPADPMDAKIGLCANQHSISTHAVEMLRAAGVTTFLEASVGRLPKGLSKTDRATVENAVKFREQERDRRKQKAAPEPGSKLGKIYIADIADLYDLPGPAVALLKRERVSTLADFALSRQRGELPADLSASDSEILFRMVRDAGEPKAKKEREEAVGAAMR